MGEGQKGNQDADWQEVESCCRKFNKLASRVKENTHIFLMVRRRIQRTWVKVGRKQQFN